MNESQEFYRLNCLIIPGLNLHPDQMSGLKRSLQFHQIDSKIVTLPGIDPAARKRNSQVSPINFEGQKTIYFLQCNSPYTFPGANQYRSLLG